MTLPEGASFADEDRRLLAAARRNRAGLEAVCRRYVGPLYVFCALRTGDSTAAASSVRAALRRAVEEIARAEEIDRPFLPWLFELAADRFPRRRAKRNRPRSARDRGPERAIADVRRLVGEIGDQPAAALVLALEEGLSIDEVAAAIGVRREQAQRLIFRVVAKVARRMGAGNEG